MFLKTIQNKEGVDRGLMVTGEGDLVVAMPNDDVWVRIIDLGENAKYEPKIWEYRGCL